MVIFGTTGVVRVTRSIFKFRGFYRIFGMKLGTSNLICRFTVASSSIGLCTRDCHYLRMGVFTVTWPLYLLATNWPRCSWWLLELNYFDSLWIFGKLLYNLCTCCNVVDFSWILACRQPFQLWQVHNKWKFKLVLYNKLCGKLYYISKQWNLSICDNMAQTSLLWFVVDLL